MPVAGGMEAQRQPRRSGLCAPGFLLSHPSSGFAEGTPDEITHEQQDAESQQSNHVVRHKVMKQIRRLPVSRMIWPLTNLAGPAALKSS
jgi:hypothetical protein